MDDDLVYQPKTDAEYIAWVTQHPDGFVVNTHGGEMMWHQVGCGYIMPGGNWSPFGHAKACSVHPGALAAWAKSRPQQSLRYCTDCRNDWTRTPASRNR